MEKFSVPGSVRIAVIVSEIIMALWVLILLLMSLFQKEIVTILADGMTIDSSEKLVLHSAVIMCIGSVVITAANGLVSKGKGVYMPLVIASIITGLMPIAVYIADTRQRIAEALLGSERLVYLSLFSVPVSLLSWLFYGGAVITIAASAVYAYARNHSA